MMLLVALAVIAIFVAWLSTLAAERRALGVTKPRHK
jgi:hypothetical protein